MGVIARAWKRIGVRKKILYSNLAITVVLGTIFCGVAILKIGSVQSDNQWAAGMAMAGMTGENGVSAISGWNPKVPSNVTPPRMVENDLEPPRRSNENRLPMLLRAP